MSDRTLQPSIKRRQEARQAGRVTATNHVGGAALWLTGSALALAVGEPVRQYVITGFKHAWAQPWEPSHYVHAAGEVRGAMMSTGMFLLPVFGLILLISVGCRLAQVGFLWAPQRIFSSISARNGWRGPSASDFVFQLGRGGALIVMAMVLLAWGIWQSADDLMHLLLVPSDMRGLAFWGLRLGLVLTVFAAVDYGYQRYRFEMSLSMTPEELREEVKAIEGNPQIAAGRRSLQRAVRSDRVPGE